MCAVQGICTAGAFYFLNEADIVICSDDATFFDSHVTYGLVSALEPVGLMRKVGLGETLRIALLGQRRAGDAPRPRCASASSPRSSTRDELWARAHEIAAGIARQADAPRRRARCARSGSRSTGPTAPRWSRASSTPALGNPIGMAEVAEQPPDRPEPRLALMRRRTAALAERIADGRSRSIPSAPALEFERRWCTWGELGATPSTQVGRARARARHARSASCCATGPASVGAAARRAARRRLRRHDQPASAASSARATDLAGARPRRASPASRTTSPTLVARRPRAHARRPRRARRAARRRRDAAPAPPARRSGRASRCGCSRAARPARRSASTSPTTRSSGCSLGAKHYERNRDADAAAALAASPSSTRRSCTSAGCSASCSA